MFKKIIYFFFIVLLSCSSDKVIKTKKKENILPADKIYELALSEYQEGRLQSSVDLLKLIESNYSCTYFSPKALLMISYLYYEGSDYLKSLEYLKKFKKLYPANKQISYADFMTGICLYEQVNSVSREQETTRLAQKQFNYVITTYPNTVYAEESKSRIDLLNEQLAGKEMYIARFYLKKKKWISAILRLQIVIEKYQNTIFIDEALHRMVEINYKIGNIEAAKKYAAILGYNHNSSDWYKKTYKIVGDKNYNIINQENKKNLKNKLLSIFDFSKND